MIARFSQLNKNSVGVQAPVKFYHVDDKKFDFEVDENFFQNFSDPTTLVIVGNGQEHLIKNVQKQEIKKLTSTGALKTANKNLSITENRPKKVEKQNLVQGRSTSRPARYVPPPEGEMARVTLDWYRQNEAGSEIKFKCQ